MATAGAIQPRCLRMLRPVASRRHHLLASTSRPPLHRRPGRRASFKGYRRFPGSISPRRLDGRPRDPGRLYSQARRPRLARRRVTRTAGSPTPPSRSRSARSPGRRELLDITNAALDRGGPRGRPTTTSAMSPPPSSARSIAGSRSSAHSWATGSAATCTRTADPRLWGSGRGPEFEAGMVLAIGRWSTRGARTFASAATTGPSTRPTARWPRISSSPSP